MYLGIYKDTPQEEIENSMDDFINNVMYYYQECKWGSVLEVKEGSYRNVLS